MNNPLSILRLVVKAVRPSRTGEMKASTATTTS